MTSPSSSALRASRNRIISAALILSGVGCVTGATLSDAEAAGTAVEVLKTPDGGIQPQAAVDSRGNVHLVYYKGEPRGGDLFYQRRTAGQDAWSTPLRVNSERGSGIAMGTIRGGQLALGKGGRVHVVWFGATAMGSGGHGGGAPLLYTRLNDAGATFEPQRNLMQFTTMLDGGPSIAADGNGNVYVAWHGGDGQSEGEGNRRLWIARSRDEGKTFAREASAWSEPTGACACCSTKAFVDRTGGVYILYRSAAAKVNRDMYLLTSGPGGERFSGQQIDRWNVGTCPMSSEAFAEGSQRVFAGWETAGQVRFTSIDPRTKKPGTPVSAPGSGPNRKHPTLAVNRTGEVLFAWTEGTGWQRGGSLAWQAYDAQGKPTGTMGRVENGIPVWGLACAVAKPDGGFLLFH